ncbi:hypothetical protein M404DRAFT_473979 [Pisolithus tinctorius Marx 270]|uniref:Uncharacterized protein n=1 Tax=Pisolithus tinctorius Marx 270 TaxID=870435 RepID=A0A0C3PXW0_PISTI|nr:hypothetical protein M404DRAFT_473979 [Pisolithus tinctorius Marx 270]
MLLRLGDRFNSDTLNPCVRGHLICPFQKCWKSLDLTAKCVCCVPQTKLQSTKRNSFVTSQASLTGKPLEVRVVCYPIEPTSPPPTNGTASVSISLSIFLHERSEVYILFFRADTYMIARQFWQMRGLGISSQYAERCLSLLVFQGSRRPASLSENFVPDGDGAAKGQTSRQIWAPFPSGMLAFLESYCSQLIPQTRVLCLGTAFRAPTLSN